MPLNPKKKIFEEAVNLYTDLSQEFKGTNGKPNLESCGAILSKLKLKLTQLNFLPAEKDCNIEKVIGNEASNKDIVNLYFKNKGCDGFKFLNRVIDIYHLHGSFLYLSSTVS